MKNIKPPVQFCFFLVIALALCACASSGGASGSGVSSAGDGVQSGGDAAASSSVSTGGSASAGGVSPDSGQTLDAAIDQAAAYFIARIDDGTTVALIPFDASTSRLSDYVFDELWRRFEDSGKFIMVDRRNLDRIESEVKLQLESGRVDDSMAVSITKQYGARILVYGQLSSLDRTYRMTIYASDVEKATSSQRVYTVMPDDLLNSLLNAPADEEVERAVQVMANAVDSKTIISVGRISYADTQTVTGLSAWLKNNIISCAQKYQDKFEVASDSDSANFAVATRGLRVEAPGTDSGIQAVVMGNYSPLDDNAEVSLRLVSTSGNREVLAASKFTITAAELERRRLSLLPGVGNTEISASEFNIRQQAVNPYDGKDNQWEFTVTPDVLDGIYYDGDYMSMSLYSEKDCYFRIIHVDVNGRTKLIYPANPNDNNFIRAGQTRRIPDNYRYRLQAPFGEEMILVAAYAQPFAPYAPDAGGLDANAISRGLTVEGSGSTAMTPSATAKISYTILPRQN